MKKSGLIRSNKERKRFLSFAIFLCVVLVVVFFSGKISNFLYQTTSPIQRSLSSMGSGTSFFVNYFLNADRIRRENSDLKKERQELISEIFSLKELETENRILREALDIGLSDDFSLVFAGISGFSFEGDSFLVDKGSKNGISEGMSVITSKKVVVGIVAEVYENFSKIMIITHKNSPFFGGRIQGEDIRGVVKGSGRFGLILDLVNKDSIVEEKKVVITTGEIFPKGMFAGTIKTVIKIDTEPFQKAEIKPLFDPRIIEDVFIITDYQR